MLLCCKSERKDVSRFLQKCESCEQQRWRCQRWLWRQWVMFFRCRSPKFLSLLLPMWPCGRKTTSCRSEFLCLLFLLQFSLFTFALVFLLLLLSLPSFIPFFLSSWFLRPINICLYLHYFYHLFSSIQQVHLLHKIIDRFFVWLDRI